MLTALIVPRLAAGQHLFSIRSDSWLFDRLFYFVLLRLPRGLLTFCLAQRETVARPRLRGANVRSMSTWLACERTRAYARWRAVRAVHVCVRCKRE